MQAEFKCDELLKCTPRCLFIKCSFQVADLGRWRVVPVCVRVAGGLLRVCFGVLGDDCSCSVSGDASKVAPNSWVRTLIGRQ